MCSQFIIKQYGLRIVFDRQRHFFRFVSFFVQDLLGFECTPHHVQLMLILDLYHFDDEFAHDFVCWIECIVYGEVLGQEVGADIMVHIHRFDFRRVEVSLGHNFDVVSVSLFGAWVKTWKQVSNALAQSIRICD